MQEAGSILKKKENIIIELTKLNDDEYTRLVNKIDPGNAILKPENLIPNIFKQQNENNFAEIFDKNLIDIAMNNNDLFSVVTSGGEKVVIFDNLSQYVNDNKNDFCKALINKIVNFSFENVFDEKFDFFSTIFEYLIKDYNSNSGGKYAEYFTPHAVSKIMSRCLIDKKTSNVTCYDPSAGSGTLLMTLAHEIGEKKCSIYSQDISQKSSQLLRLNLILNNLVHSIPNVIQGNTLLNPFHKDLNKIKKFDFIVSNPPFKSDFSDYREDLDTNENKDRFFSGIPGVPPKDKDKMPIYLLFIQHIISSLNSKGKAAIVVPAGFLSAQKGIGKDIREKIVNSEMFRGAISMPSNIFAKTGTNVAIIFLDKTWKEKKVTLIDASNLGEIYKDGKNQKTILSSDDENIIIENFRNSKKKDNFSVSVDLNEIKKKNYSFFSRHYFELKINLNEISKSQFDKDINSYKKKLTEIIKDSNKIDNEIKSQLSKLTYNE